ncbi:hypothetical protein BDM02DRAFT_3119894 [Thelephora ganbajun]|uniref:Uncharacterized protein n=1 Tax=Thelephora ganbajun TaxID=370292 RepID=A0ACB6Z7C8_THEGA|nr:hypothetical protein BDM02DRAFT_3119894 [Thelephora ganbajun]
MFSHAVPTPTHGPRRVFGILHRRRSVLDGISKSWKVRYSLSAPGDRTASSTRAYNELYGLTTDYVLFSTPRR